MRKVKTRSHEGRWSHTVAGLARHLAEVQQVGARIQVKHAERLNELSQITDVLLHRLDQVDGAQGAPDAQLLARVEQLESGVNQRMRQAAEQAVREHLGPIHQLKALEERVTALLHSGSPVDPGAREHLDRLELECKRAHDRLDRQQGAVEGLASLVERRGEEQREHRDRVGAALRAMEHRMRSVEARPEPVAPGPQNDQVRPVRPGLTLDPEPDRERPQPQVHPRPTVFFDHGHHQRVVECVQQLDEARARLGLHVPWTRTDAHGTVSLPRAWIAAHQQVLARASSMLHDLELNRVGVYPDPDVTDDHQRVRDDDDRDHSPIQ
jgi:hypothetical protein